MCGLPPWAYLWSLVSLALLIWSITADVLLLQQLYELPGMLQPAAAATAAVAMPHLATAAAIVLRNGWMSNGAHCCRWGPRAGCLAWCSRELRGRQGALQAAPT